MAFLLKKNPDAYENNTLVIPKNATGCCGDSEAICSYSATLTNLAGTGYKAVILVEDGVEVTYDFSANQTTLAGLKKELSAAIVGAGYLETEGSIFSYAAGAVNKLEIFSEVEIHAIVENDDDEVDFTEDCTPSAFCWYALNFEGAGTNPAFSVGTVSGTLTGTFDDGSNGTQRTTLDTQLDTFFSTNSIEVTDVIVSDDGNGDFLVEIRTIPGRQIKLDGNEAVISDCRSKSND